MKAKSTQLALFPELETALTLPTEEVDIFTRVEAATSAKTGARFSELVAGLAVYIPAHVDADHWLSQAVGVDDAQVICDLIADGFGVTMDFPLGSHSRWAQARADIAALINEGGMSANEIAAATGTSRGTVQRVKRRMIDFAKKQGSKAG
ncbi:MAG: helix-turn-helix domain-containing protein [Pseudomonadota bacterium]